MPTPYENLLNQINRAQARKTLAFAFGAGLVAALGVVSADLPKIVDAATPLGATLLTLVLVAQKYLNTGKS